MHSAMHPLLCALAETIDQSLNTAHELKLDSVEELLAMASLELSSRIDIIEHRAAPKPLRPT